MPVPVVLILGVLFLPGIWKSRDVTSKHLIEDEKKILWAIQGKRTAVECNGQNYLTLLLEIFLESVLLKYRYNFGSKIFFLKVPNKGDQKMSS